MIRSVRFGGLKISSLLFMDYLLRLAPSNSDLQLAPRLFAVECEVAGKRLGTSKSVAMVLSWKRVSKRSVPAPSREVQVVCDLVRK